MSKKTNRLIDLGHRPYSYRWAREIGVQLPSSIRGAERRARYEQLLAEGRHEEIDELISKPALDDDERREFGSIDPGFMGGEYLPDDLEDEDEIARITIASTTRDVTCVMARERRGRIRYRLVDEYGGETLSGRKTRTSVRPLTLKQLTDFFLGGWNLMAVLAVNFHERGYPRDAVQAFVLEASSSAYAEFEALVRRRIDDWLDTVVDATEKKGDQGRPRRQV